MWRRLPSIETVVYAAAVLMAVIVLAMIPRIDLTADETRALLVLVFASDAFSIVVVRAQARVGWSRVAPFAVPTSVILVTLAFAVLYRVAHAFWVVYFILPASIALLFGVAWAYLAGVLSILGFVAVVTLNGTMRFELSEQFLAVGTLAIFTIFVGGLVASIRQRGQKQDALAALAAAMNQSLALDQVLESAVDQVVRALGVDAAAILFVEGDTLVTRAQRGLSPEFLEGVRGLKVGEGLSGRVAKTGKIELVTAGLRRDARLTRQVVRRSEFEAFVGVPLRAREGVIGVMNLATRRARAFSTDDLAFFQAVANQVAIAIVNARLYEESQARARRLVLLNEFAAAMNREVDLAALLENAQCLVAELGGGETMWISLMDEQTGDFSLAADRELPPALAANDQREMRSSPCRCQQLLREGKLTEAVNILACERFERVGMTAYHASVPLKSGDRALGILNVVKPHGAEFAREDLLTLGAMGAQLGSAIERARLHEKVKARHIEEQAALLKFSTGLVGLLEGETVLDRAAEIAQELFHADAVSLMLADERRENLVLRAARGLARDLIGAVAIDIATSRAGRAFRANTVMWRNGDQVPSQADCPLGFAEQGFRACITAPLRTDRDTFGTLRAHFRASRAFDDHDTRLLSNIANQTAIAFERARLYADAHEQLERITALHDIDLAITSEMNLAQTLGVLLDQVARRLRVDAAAVALIDPATRALNYAARYGAGEAFFRDGLLHVEEGITGQVAHTGKPAAIEDVRAEARFVRRAVAEQLGLISYLAVPLHVGEQVIGVLELAKRARHTFTPGEIDFFLTLGGQAAIAIQNARLFEAEQTRRAELTALYELSRALADENDLDALLAHVTRHAVETVRVTLARVALIQGNECVMRAAYPSRVLTHDLIVGQRQAMRDMPICEHVAQQNDPVVLRRDDPTLGAVEREVMLFHNTAETVCLVPLRSGDRVLGLLVLSEMRREERGLFTGEKLGLARSIGDQAASAIRRAELFAELERAYLQTVLALANTVDAKDTYTADHAQRLAEMALAVGRALGLSARELEDLRYGAILHDIGKIGVPDAVLQKPGKLTEQEWLEMRHHPEIGAHILAPVPRLAGAARVVRHHHERCDGEGYPDGLAGDAIPLGARILTVVDSFSAILDRRVYKEARPVENAIAELRRCSGTQFDPRVVEVFLRLLERGVIPYLGQAETKLEPHTDQH